ncbi:MAG: sialidase family protein, partial [Caldilinea sp.]
MPRAIFAVVFLFVVGLAFVAPQAGATVDAPAIPTVAGGLLAFGALGEQSAWVLTGESLLITGDGGVTWRDMTPPALAPHRQNAVAFLDAQMGWTAHVDGADLGAVTVATTVDGGLTWQISRHQLLASDDPAAMTSSISVFWYDHLHGWLMLRQATSSNFNRGSLFRTQDGGERWQQVAAPSGNPV